MDGNVAPTRALSDEDGQLISADLPLARLQKACGGAIPGPIAIPQLRELVDKARGYGLRLARTISAQDGADVVTVWAEVEPADGEEGGCAITLRNWQSSPLPEEAPLAAAQRQGRVDRTLAELVARLDAAQCLLHVTAEAPDLAPAAAAMAGGLGRPWTDFVRIDGNGHEQPLHWRLLTTHPVDDAAQHTRRGRPAAPPCPAAAR